MICKSKINNYFPNFYHTDTLAALARTIGKENFLPLAADFMNLGLTMLENGDDPDLRRSCYNLFASIASVVTVEMASVLPQIVKALLDSVKSTEGIVSSLYKNEDALNGVGTEINDEDLQEIDIENSDNEEEDDEDEIDTLAVENAYLGEKEEAILALMELAEHTGIAFAPYIQISFEEIYKLINYPSEDIRKCSIDALKQFVISLYQLNNQDGVNQTLLILIPKLSEIIRTDEERTVVMAALDAFHDILDKLKTAAIQADGQKDAIFNCIIDVVNNKVACQYDEQIDEDQEESEYDEAIIESAGEILPRFGLALEPSEFAQYFERILPYFVQKIEKTKQKDETTDSQRAAAIGVLSECFGGLQQFTGKWLDDLLNVLLSCLNDRNDEVRNNSVYGLGEIILNSKELSHKYYPQILSALSAIVTKEQHPGTLDNICGALARVVEVGYTLVPLKEVMIR